MPLLNQSQPAARTTCNQQDDTLSKKPAPKTIQYQPTPFNLDRPTMHLTMEERIQVHHNYISAISNLKHKKISLIGYKEVTHTTYRPMKLE